jgi:hypothetical protein
MTEPTFAPLYRRFLALISQPEPLASAANERARSDPDVTPLGRWIAACEESGAIAGLGVYAHMYFARLRDSLAQDFKAFAELVGQARFERLAAEYLVRYPSDNPSLRYHGRRFPSFVAEWSSRGGAAGGEPRPDLGDLCALEWARIEVFDAPDAVPISPSRLATLAPEDWLEFSLLLAPSHRLLWVEHDVEPLWLACERSLPVPEPSRGGRMLLVWRRGFSVLHRAVSDEEAQLLAMLVTPTTLAELCSVLAEDRALSEASALALRLLNQWLADELLVSEPNRD